MMGLTDIVKGSVNAVGTYMGAAVDVIGAFTASGVGFGILGEMYNIDVDLQNLGILVTAPLVYLTIYQGRRFAARKLFGGAQEEPVLVQNNEDESQNNVADEAGSQATSELQSENIDIRLKLKSANDELEKAQSVITRQQHQLKGLEDAAVFMNMPDAVHEIFGCILNEFGHHYMLVQKSGEVLYHDGALPKVFNVSEIKKYGDVLKGFDPFREDSQARRDFGNSEYLLKAKVIPNGEFSFVVIKDLSAEGSELGYIDVGDLSERLLANVLDNDPRYPELKQSLEYVSAFVRTLLKTDSVPKAKRCREDIQAVVVRDGYRTAKRDADKVLGKGNGYSR